MKVEENLEGRTGEQEGDEQSRKKLVSWIPRNIYKNAEIEEHSVKITKNFVAFHVK